MSNPKKKRSSRRRRNPAISFSGKRRSRRNRSKRRSHRNPSVSRALSLGGSQVGQLLPLSGGVLVGTFIPRAVVQMILGANNTGITGYGAQVLASAILAWVGSKGLGKNFGAGVISGGIAATAYRVYQEHNPTTPTAIVKSASGGADTGMGDLDFSDNGLGIYVNQPFTFPQTNQFVNGALVSAPAIGPAALPPAQAVPAIPAQGTTADLDRYSRY
ncbi:MAG TPA: hypothetical protein VJN64_11755 [Terriglobales bacterium]|nr:hypothetical protein [Terriglobales bacterium]